MRADGSLAVGDETVAPVAARRAQELLHGPDGVVWASRDALWRGRLPLWQPARGRGYRFTLDAVLLASFAPAVEDGEALDLGAGCGIVGLMLLALGKAARLTAVERQPAAAALATRNVADYGWQQRAQVVCGDLRAGELPRADLVTFNPPYFALAHSKPSTEPGRDAGRRECFGTLADFVARAAACLRPSGQLACIVPYARRAELRTLVQQAGLVDVGGRPVRPRAAAAPLHLLLSARRPAAGSAAPAAPDASAPVAAWCPPLVVHADAGGYTPEVQALIDGPAAWQHPANDGANRWPSVG